MNFGEAWIVHRVIIIADSLSTAAHGFEAIEMDHCKTGYWKWQFVVSSGESRTATAGSDVVQSGHPIFDDFFQHLWPYIGNNTANVVFQMVKRLWLIRIDQ
ncbi:hypothetical protein TNCV_3853531 [Trichonephila clavipes]|nr:hypothetical protein TNCV_3853531 [Trichonephila clavipes]